MIINDDAHINPRVISSPTRADARDGREYHADWNNGNQEWHIKWPREIGEWSINSPAKPVSDKGYLFVAFYMHRTQTGYNITFARSFVFQSDRFVATWNAILIFRLSFYSRSGCLFRTTERREKKTSWTQYLHTGKLNFEWCKNLHKGKQLLKESWKRKML